MMTTLMLDLNNLAVRAVFMDKEMINNPNPDWGLHKHTVLQSILFNIKKFNPNSVILGVDDRNCWRKKIFPEYKAHRKDKKDKDIFPWDKFYAHLEEFVQEIKDTFPFYVIQVPYSEADDVIAVLTNHISGHKVIVTADSDYIQLLNIKDVQLYNPIQKKFVQDTNPNQTTLIKIIAGDAGDNIPNIKPRVGPKTAEKMILEGTLQDFIEEHKLQANLERNTKLIDWAYIPDVLKKRIIDTWYNYEFKNNSINNNELFNFFIRHKLRNQLENISITKQILKPLYDTYMEEDFAQFCEERGND